MVADGYPDYALGEEEEGMGWEHSNTTWTCALAAKAAHWASDRPIGVSQAAPHWTEG